MNPIINKLQDIITIWYSGGMRGNSIYRILAVHPEVYWNNDIQKTCSLDAENCVDSLTLPETVSTFNCTPGKSYNSVYAFAYSSYHCICFMHDTNFKYIVKQWLLSPKKQLLFSTKHSTNMPLTSLPDKPFIWLYGNRHRIEFPITYFPPTDHPFAYNLNIDKLYSEKYIEFEEEYYKLISHFNLSSKINRVRAFILLSLEREKYINNYLKPFYCHSNT
jgi:hypothetical protein